MTPEQEERLVCAFESIAVRLGGIGKTLELDYAKKYPTPRGPTEPTVTHVKTEDELLRESLGETGEKTTEDWLDIGIGPREREFIEEDKKRQAAETAERDSRKARP